jgi:hypothetical protein
MVVPVMAAIAPLVVAVVVVVVVAVVGAGNWKPVLLEVTTLPRVPVQAALVGQQAMLLAASCVHVVPA